MKQMQFMARRGAPIAGRRPNSLSAFERLAESNKFDLVELDIRRSRTDDQGDRTPVIAFSASVSNLYESQRIAKRDRAHQNVEISDLTYEMLKNDALEIIPLEAALRLLQGRRIVLTLLDQDAIDQVASTVKDLAAEKNSRLKLEHLVVASTSVKTLVRSRQILASAELALIIKLKQLIELFRPKIEVDYHFISRSLYLFLWPWLRWTKTSTRVFVYNVTSPWQIKLIDFLGANGVITSRFSLAPDTREA